MTFDISLRYSEISAFISIFLLCVVLSLSSAPESFVMQELESSLYELILRASVTLPSDVCKALECCFGQDNTTPAAGFALDVIADNISRAGQLKQPLCQDTGLPAFFVRVPAGTGQTKISTAIRKMISQATADGILRPNSVNSVSGVNTGNNLGNGTPAIHFEEWDKSTVAIDLMLKGGGCENVGAQYSLPSQLDHLGFAARDIDGVRKCILHAVWKAQGMGCSPGVVGVCIGGDRQSGYEEAKKQLFRSLDDNNDDSVLDTLEKTVCTQANHLGIGPMGLGAGQTLLACKIGSLNRIPASFFVTVAYSCWALRRVSAELNGETGYVISWSPSSRLDREPFAGCAESRVFRIREGVDEETLRKIKVGDIVRVDGRIFTGRDMVHAALAGDTPMKEKISAGIIYHCGPVVVRDGDEWCIKAAGPTTSIREEPYQAQVMQKHGFRVIIGKGGMGRKTSAALKNLGGVYLTAVGGAAQHYAAKVRKVRGVEFEKFGVPEAMWELDVEGFYAVCTMDAHGGCLHTDVKNKSAGKLSCLSDDGEC